MPQVTVYIREDDLEAWKALEHKSQAISDMLNDVEDNFVGLKPPPVQRNARQSTWKERLAGSPDTIELPPTKLCKIHGVPLTDMGKCLQKGCKYA